MSFGDRDIPMRRNLVDLRPWAVIDRHGRVIARFHVQDNAEQHACVLNFAFEASPLIHDRYQVRHDPSGRTRLEP